MLRNSDTAAAGVLVRLTSTNYWAISDASGQLDIPDLLPGPYSLTLVDPQLHDLGINLAPFGRFVAARDSVASGTYGLTTIEDYIVDKCGRDASRDVLLLGRVVDKSGGPLTGIEVHFAHPQSEPFAGVVTGSDGVFALCRGASQAQDLIVIRVVRRGGPERTEMHALKAGVTIIPIVLDTAKRNAPTSDADKLHSHRGGR